MTYLDIDIPRHSTSHVKYYTTNIMQHDQEQSSMGANMNMDKHEHGQT